jgi:hypothetical protein
MLAGDWFDIVDFAEALSVARKRSHESDYSLALTATMRHAVYYLPHSKVGHMGMPSSSSLVLFGATIGLGLFIDALFFMNLSCTQPLYAELIRATAGGSCPDFWFNRYQTLIAALIALLGAVVTVNALWRQTEAMRADQAEMRLARYSGAFLDVMIRYHDLEPMRDNETEAEAKPRFRVFDDTTDAQAIREAMIDAALGLDRFIVGTFVSRTRLAALARFYGQPDTDANAISVDPIYRALCRSVLQRRELLREGVRVYDISKIALIDANEVTAAHREKREPLLTPTTA